MPKNPCHNIFSNRLCQGIWPNYLHLGSSTLSRHCYVQDKTQWCLRFHNIQYLHCCSSDSSTHCGMSSHTWSARMHPPTSLHSNSSSVQLTGTGVNKELRRYILHSHNSTIFWNQTRESAQWRALCIQISKSYLPAFIYSPFHDDLPIIGTNTVLYLFLNCIWFND